MRRQRLDARLEEWTLRTPALDGSTGVRVLLPAGYRAAPRRRYPVLYLLHGRGSDYRSWTRQGDAEAITARAPMIVVMPDGGTAGWYTDWYEDKKAVQPRWETYHVGQLIPWVDATYRTVAARRGRAVAGLSMGGFGALSYAVRHPGTFAAAASYSGALEVGSDEAWGPQSENAARWRAHLPISNAARLRSFALIELRTGDGRPGPLDRRGTSPDCDACSSSGICTGATRGSIGGCRSSASATPGTTTAPGRMTGRTGSAPCARRCPPSSGRSRATDRGTATRTAMERDTPFDGGAGRCTIPQTSSSAKAKKGAPP